MRASCVRLSALPRCVYITINIYVCLYILLPIATLRSSWICKITITQECIFPGFNLHSGSDQSVSQLPGTTGSYRCSLGDSDCSFEKKQWLLLRRVDGLGFLTKRTIIVYRHADFSPPNKPNRLQPQGNCFCHFPELGGTRSNFL